MTLSDIIGQENAKLALILNAIDPRCGGVLFIGEKGVGKSALARSFADLAGEGRPFVELPLNATEDALLGSVDLEKTLAAGTTIRQSGLLGRAGGGALHIDDVNLLSPEILALVLKGQDCAIEGARRNGPLNFILLAGMNPEEGSLSSHFLDRFGMCVPMEALKGTPERIAVMKRARATDPATQDIQATQAAPGPFRSEGNPDAELRDRIASARNRADRITVPVETMSYLVGQCIDNLVCGHRGDIHLFYAARAYAALAGAATVDKAHVDAVLPLVLAHRRRLLQEPQAQQEKAREDPQQKNENEKNRQDVRSSPEAQQKNGEESGGPEKNETAGRPRESVGAEEIFETGRDFKVRRLTFRKDRMNRTVPGRRTKTGSRGKRGRHVKSILRDNGDIAVDATIRAAASFQKLRGRTGMLLIRDEDLRYRQRERRMGHLVIFVVDGSGSMGAQRRMVETKGAIQSLLMDCYQKRDRVSLIVFRKNKAEVVLPPTASVEAASKRLKDIPVGGKTPLAAGLLEAFNLIKRTRIKSAETRFLVIVVTDGRANQTLSAASVKEEIARVTDLLGKLPATDYVVVDTEDKTQFTRTDLARKLSSALEADYYEIDTLQADCLAAVVREKRQPHALGQ